MAARGKTGSTGSARRAGILGTVIFHLLLAILLAGRGIYRQEVHAGVEITLDLPDPEALRQHVEELKRQHEELLRARADEEVREMLRSIAVNEELARKAPPAVEREIERYIGEIREELREEAARDGRYAVKRDEHHAADSLQARESRRQRELDSLQSVVYAGESSVSYKLAGRYKTDLPVPVFRCEFGGKVVVAIVVNPRGEVVKAEVVDAGSKPDDCLREVAVAAAARSRFNEDDKAPPRQPGVITYNFVKQ
jgi:hypothetical protein